MYPDLRPVTPPPTLQHAQWEQPHDGIHGMAAPDWEGFASSIAEGISGAKSKMQSIKKLSPPKFSGKTSDYPR